MQTFFGVSEFLFTVRNGCSQLVPSGENTLKQFNGHIGWSRQAVNARFR